MLVHGRMVYFGQPNRAAIEYFSTCPPFLEQGGAGGYSCGRVWVRLRAGESGGPVPKRAVSLAVCSASHKGLYCASNVMNRPELKCTRRFTTCPFPSLPAVLHPQQRRVPSGHHHGGGQAGQGKPATHGT